MLFYVGFVSAVLGLIYVIRKTIKSRNILTPQIFLFVGLLLYLYIPAVVLRSDHIQDNKFNLLIFLGVIGCFIASKIIPYNILDKDFSKIYYEPKLRWFQLGSFAYAVYLLYEIFSRIRMYGILGAFTVNRLSNYLGASVVETSLVSRVITETCKIFFYIYIAYLFSKKRYIYAFMLYTIPMIHHRFTAVTRYDFVALAGALVVYIIDEHLYVLRREPSEGERVVKKIDKIEVKKKRIKIFRIAIIGFVGGYAALVFMRISNYTRFGQSATGISLSIVSLIQSTLSNDSLYYEYFYYLYNAIQKGMAELEYGFGWFVYPIINFIPRLIWAGKPYTAFSARWTDKIYWSLTSGNPVVTFSILGEGYAQFGIIGCLLCPLVFIGCRWINFRTIRKIKYGNLYLLVIMFSLLTYMRSEAPIFYSIVDQILLLLICRFCMRKVRHE